MAEEGLSDKDLIELEQYCLARFQKKYFIKDGMYLSIKAFDTLKSIKNKTNQQTVLDCIEQSQGKFKMTFFVDVTCNNCKAITNVQMTKTSLIEALSDKRTYLCKDCEKKQIDRNKEATEKEFQKTLQREKQETQRFIKQYLNPDAYWKETISPSKYFTLLKNDACYTNRNEVADYIKNMPYKDFLKTPYWKAVAQRKRYKANFRCELCNTQGLLNVHHKSYKNHGYEMYDLQDLIVLCDECHKKFHDIVD